MKFSSRSIRTTAAAAFAAVVFAVAACGGDDSGSSSSGKLKGTTIDYWASNQGATIDQDNQVISEAAARFKKATGVTVKHKVIPWSDLFTNITTATTSGKGPDVLNIGNTWSATLQATGAFIPFEGETLEAVGGKDKFLETSFAASGAPGKEPTSVPLYGLSYGLFYNKKLFKDANLQPPKTWSEFVSTAKKLTKDTNGDGKPDQWGFAMEGGSITENAHFAFILGRQNGGKLFDGNKPTFDSPEIVKAVSDYVNLIGRDKVSDPGNAQYADGTRTAAQFAKGKTGMMIYQNNAENNLKSEGMPKSAYGVAEVPVMDGSDTPIMTHVAGINISVFANTKKKAAALEWVKFLTSPEEQVKLNQSFGSLPVVKEAQSDPAFATPNLKTFNGILAEHAEPMPLIPEEGQMETFIGEAMKGLISDSATKGPVSDAEVEAALKSANEKMAAAGGG
jgi:multiple sugar transport system substrate-binding protein